MCKFCPIATFSSKKTLELLSITSILALGKIRTLFEMNILLKLPIYMGFPIYDGKLNFPKNGLYKTPLIIQKNLNIITAFGSKTKLITHLVGVNKNSAHGTKQEPKSKRVNWTLFNLAINNLAQNMPKQNMHLLNARCVIGWYDQVDVAQGVHFATRITCQSKCGAAYAFGLLERE